MKIKLNKKYTVTSIPKNTSDTDNPLINGLWENEYSFCYKSILGIKYLLWTNLRVQK